MIPIKFMERTPNMKSYAQHKYQEWREKNGIVDNIMDLKNKFYSKNHVTPLNTLIV